MRLVVDFQTGDSLSARLDMIQNSVDTTRRAPLPAFRKGSGFKLLPPFGQPSSGKARLAFHDAAGAVPRLDTDIGELCIPMTLGFCSPY